MQADLGVGGCVYEISALREAAGILGRYADADLHPGGTPAELMDVVRHAADAVQDVLLVAELRRRGIEPTRIDPFGTVVRGTGPMICFMYRGRPCGVEAIEDGSWRVFADPPMDDISPEQFDLLELQVQRAGLRFADLLVLLFAVLDQLVDRVAQVEVAPRPQSA